MVNYGRAPVFPKFDIGFALAGNQAVGDDLTPHRLIASAGSITSVRAIVKTAATGADLTFRVKLWRGGVDTVISDAITIAATETDSGAIAISPAVGVVAGDYLTIDCTSIGSSDPGVDATVMLGGRI